MEKKYIHHITHFSNLPGILSEGGIWCDNASFSQGHCQQSIGHSNIKERRQRRRVEELFGGDVSKGGVVADYVPFYFCYRSPMLYAIKGGFVEGYTGGQGQIAYLVSSVSKIAKSDLDWCFTDGHAAEDLTDFFDDLKDLSRIDWDIIKDWSWKSTTSDPDRKRKKQAEFLVHHFFPWEKVIGIGVYDQEGKEEVTKLLEASGQDHRPEIKILKKWYC